MAVAAGVAFLVVAPILIATPGHVAVALCLIGMALVDPTFFGGGGAPFVPMLFDRRPGLVFDREGLTDRTTGLGVGFVSWAEVTGGLVIRGRSSRSLMVAVSDPRKYWKQGRCDLRLLSGANMLIFGTPICLSSGSLSIGFDEMVAVFNRFHAHYRRPL